MSSFGLTSLPDCPEYHANSDKRRAPGYYPNISPQQLAAATALKTKIDGAGFTAWRTDDDEFLTLLRFLRARKFNVDQAYDMIQADALWREKENINALKTSTAFDVLQCDVAAMFELFPTWIQGHDKQFRPVSYRKFGKFEIWKILQMTSIEHLVRFHAWESEMALRLMRDTSTSLGCNIETFTVVIDAEGWSMRLATSEAFTFIKAMATIDADHYPERLGTLVVVNAPSMLSFAWKIIQSFLDDVTKAKIKILSSSRREWEPVLRDLIDADQIPMHYGGTAPDLCPEDAINGMNPPPPPHSPPPPCSTTSSSSSSSFAAAPSPPSPPEVVAASPPPSPVDVVSPVPVVDDGPTDHVPTGPSVTAASPDANNAVPSPTPC